MKRNLFGGLLFMAAACSLSSEAQTIAGSRAICAGSSTTLTDAAGGGTWSSSDAAKATINATTGVITGVANGSVVISYVRTGGVDTARITIDKVPYAGSLSNNLYSTIEACVGTAQTEYTDGDAGGVWSSSSPAAVSINASSGVFTALNYGAATLYYTVTNSCGTATATGYVSVDYNVPSLTAYPVKSTICVGETTSAVLGGGTTFGYLLCYSAAATVPWGSHQIVGVAPGTAQVNYVATNGCGITAVNMPIVVRTSTPSDIYGAGNVCVGGTVTMSDPDGAGTWSSSNPAVGSINSATGVFSGLAAGSTVITYTGTNDCGTGSITKTVQVNNSAPNAGTIPGSGIICGGNVASSLAGTSPGGKWTSSNSYIAYVSADGNTVYGGSAGTATLTYTVNNGCSSASVNRVITVTAPMVTNARLVPPGALCLGGTLTLSASPSGGAWMSGSSSVSVNAATGVATGVGLGNARIYYTFNDGCSNTDNTLDMTVTSTPSAATISGAGTLCQGSTATLTASATGGAWSSANSAVATISSTGMVTGIAAGTALISYSMSTGGSCVAVSTTVVTVNSLAAAGSITGTKVVCEGNTTTLANTTIGGIWSSGSPAVATIGTNGIVTGIAAGTAIITYNITGTCGSSATAVVTVNPAISAGTISGPSSVNIGSSITLTDAVSGGSWNSGNTSRATVSAGGVVSGLSEGTVVISYTKTASCGSAVATTTLSVISLAAGITGQPAVCVGGMATLSDATPGGAWYSNDTTIASINASGVVTGRAVGTATIMYVTPVGTATMTMTVGVISSLLGGSNTACVGSTAAITTPLTGGTWSSSVPGIANINSSGTYTGMAAGTATISYSLGAGCRAITVVTIMALPAAITGTLAACEGATSALGNTATGGTWTAADAGIASVNVTSGVVSGIAAGSTVVTYTTGNGCYRTATFTVKPVPATIAGTLSLCVGAATTLTDASTPAVGWSSGTPSVASVNSGTGAVNGIAAGTAIITYTLGTGCNTTAVVTVNGLPDAITGPAATCTGNTITLSETTTGGTWNSGNTARATVNALTGAVTGVSAGTVAVSYTSGTGCVRATTLTIGNAPGTINGTLSLCPSGTATLGNSVAGGTWSSTNTAVAAIGSSNGVVSGVLAGTSTVSYITATGCVATTVVTVAAPAAIGTASAVLCAGGNTTVLTAGAGGGTWSSSNGAIATVASTGATTATATTSMSPGTVTIAYATGSACRSTLVLTVNAQPSLISGNFSVCMGGVSTLSNSYSGGTWLSDNTAVAQLLTTSGTNGAVQGVAVGTATITYQYISTGCMRTQVVSVNASPSAGVISGGSAIHIALTPTLALSASGDAGGTWTSGSTAKATVDASGVVTGIAAGTSMISYTVVLGSCTSRATQLVSVYASREENNGMAATVPGNISLFPNPNSGRFMLSGAWGNVLADHLMVQVMDMAGRMVFDGTVPVGNGVVSYELAPGGNWPAGTYLLRLSDGTGRQMIPFVVW